MIPGNIFPRVLKSTVSMPGIPVCVRWLWGTFMSIADEETGVVLLPLHRLAAEAGMTDQETREGLRWLTGAVQGQKMRVKEYVSLEGEHGWQIVEWDKIKAMLQRDFDLARGVVKVRKSRARAKAREQARQAPFVPPTLEEVRAHLVEKGISELAVDPERFMAHYEGTGWRKSNNSLVRDWKACVKTFLLNERDRGNPHAQKGAIVVPGATGGPERALGASASKEAQFKATHGGYTPREWVGLSPEEKERVRAAKPDQEERK